uniref:Uncharacterized protein n=1 Tax=Rhizophora mucronata TaxID=61149 RepID=A0A2P2KGR8_RHIMU
MTYAFDHCFLASCLDDALWFLAKFFNEKMLLLPFWIRKEHKWIKINCKKRNGKKYEKETSIYLMPCDIW